MGESLAKAFADVYQINSRLILANTELFSLKTLSRNTLKQKTDIHINSEIKQKCCRRISCGSIFVFGSDFRPCYKIAFEKQGVRLSTVWWSRGAQGWTPLRSSGFAFKGRFYIIQRDIVNAQRLLAGVDDEGKVIVIQIDGMNKDVDDGSALIHIVGGHLADIVQKGQNLRLGQHDLLVFLDSELCLQLCLFRHALVEPLRQHLHGPPLLNGFPEIFNGRIRLSDRFFQCLGGQVIRAFGALSWQ